MSSTKPGVVRGKIAGVGRCAEGNTFEKTTALGLVSSLLLGLASVAGPILLVSRPAVIHDPRTPQTRWAYNQASHTAPHADQLARRREQLARYPLDISKPRCEATPRVALKSPRSHTHVTADRR